MEGEALTGSLVILFPVLDFDSQAHNRPKEVFFIALTARVLNNKPRCSVKERRQRLQMLRVFVVLVCHRMVLAASGYVTKEQVTERVGEGVLLQAGTDLKSNRQCCILYISQGRKGCTCTSQASLLKWSTPGSRWLGVRITADMVK